MAGRLLLLFIGVPLIELILFLQVGQWIGLWPTVAIVLVTGVAGATLTRQQGWSVWRRFHESLASGRLPHGELVEGLLILIAGAFLLTPGFLTDITGFLLLIPPVRAEVVRRLQNRLLERVQVDPGTATAAGPGDQGPVPPLRRPRGPVIDVEVVDDD